MKNVLIYPAGTEIGLEVFRALKYQKDFKVFGANTQKDHSFYKYDKVYYIPDIYGNTEGAISALKSLIKELSIDFVFPCHDEVIYRLSKSGIKEIILPEVSTAFICRSKSETYMKFKGILPVPEMYSLANVVFPAFCKPDKGQGSRGTYKVELPHDLYRRKDELILEYLPGKEYTVDCFTDRNRNLLYVCARERSRINSGISIGTDYFDSTTLEVMARVINDNLLLRGQWFFQVKQRADLKYVLMEIAPRAAGSSCLARARGVNLPLLTLYDQMGIDVTIIENEYITHADRALENKYDFNYKFSNVFIDKDDTLFCPEIIGLIYKLKYQGKRIYLITKDEMGSTLDSLKSNHIELTLFDQIYNVKSKWEYIVPGSIFIDDSFAERSEIAEKRSIPVFDVQQAIEAL